VPLNIRVARFAEAPNTDGVSFPTFALKGLILSPLRHPLREIVRSHQASTQQQTLLLEGFSFVIHKYGYLRLFLKIFVYDLDIISAFEALRSFAQFWSSDVA